MAVVVPVDDEARPLPLRREFTLLIDPARSVAHMVVGWLVLIWCAYRVQDAAVAMHAAEERAIDAAEAAVGGADDQRGDGRRVLKQHFGFGNFEQRLHHRCRPKFKRRP